MIDVRALAEQAGAREYHVNRSLVPFDGQALVGDEITRFARLVLNEAAKVALGKSERPYDTAHAAYDAILSLAPEEGKPGAPTS